VPDYDTWRAAVSEQNKALVRKIYQATETGDAAILDAVVTEDVIEHPLNPGQPPGREALKRIFGGFSVLVPDLRITVEDVIAAGDRVAVRSTVAGTPAGPYLGVDPAGRPMRFEAIDIWRIEDGLVAEGWHVEDFVAALVDWGVLSFAARPQETAPPPADAAMDSPADPLAVVRRWHQALRSADVGVLGTIFGDHFVNHGPIGAGVPISSGRAGISDDVISLHRAFPDIDVIAADMFAEHDKVVTRIITRGTHLGPLPHIPPTARRTAVMGHEIWRVANERILEHWGRFEDLDLLHQLGVLPAPPVPA
jgi:predicted ester cyclase